MLRKRLIGVITVRGDRAVQSFGYRRHLPLGTAECLAGNLDRWGVDEIVVQVIDRAGRGPDLALVQRLGALGLQTPLAYGGGIRNAADAVEAVHAGADRVVVDALLHDAPREVESLAARLGAQAVIAALPLARSGGELRCLDHRTRSETPLGAAALDVIAARHVAEILVIDWQHEGTAGNFDVGLLDALPAELRTVSRIAFGGVGVPGQVQAVLARDDVSAVALGNILSYREHAVQACRGDLVMLRPALYREAE